MSLDVLDGKVLENPPRPQHLACVAERRPLESRSLGHLTPMSTSLAEEPQSDISDHDLGDTGPSSIEDHNVDVAASSQPFLKSPTVDLEPASVSVSSHMAATDHRHKQTSNEAHPLLLTPTHELELTDTLDRLLAADPKSQIPPLHSYPMRTLLLSHRRHTDSAVPTIARHSTEGTSHENNAHQKRTHRLGSVTRETFTQLKSRTVTDLHLHSRQSVADLEFSRMRSSIIRRSTLRRREFTDSDNVLLGNKIDEGHRNYVMAYNMLTGIRVAVSGCSGVMKSLSDRDFRSSRKLTFNPDGSELTPSSKYDFKFKDYCPEVFRELRSLFGIDPADYLMSITGKYILSELGSPGKSGSFFYYSRDFRFIIKTIHHSEHKQLRKILKSYYLHVKENPNTLISQFYGLHRLKVKGGIKKIHFIVMNNLFPPHRDIHIKYDLKGSTWGRYTKTNKQGDDDKDISEYTLKDLNWLERKDKIHFGPAKEKIFLRQLEADVKLLKKINVMDYSLLLGVHDVKKGNSLATAKLSVYEPKSDRRAELFKTSPRDIDRGVDLPSGVFPGRSKYIFYGHDGGIRATDDMNDPLPEIYYLGIIDCLTNYSWKKRLETLWRSLSHPRGTISAIPAKEYGDRFLEFIKGGLASNKLKKT